MKNIFKILTILFFAVSINTASSCNDERRCSKYGDIDKKGLVASTTNGNQLEDSRGIKDKTVYYIKDSLGRCLCIPEILNTDNLELVCEAKSYSANQMFIFDRQNLSSLPAYKIKSYLNSDYEVSTHSATSNYCYASKISYTEYGAIKSRFSIMNMDDYFLLCHNGSTIRFLGVNSNGKAELLENNINDAINNINCHWTLEEVKALTPLCKKNVQINRFETYELKVRSDYTVTYDINFGSNKTANLYKMVNGAMSSVLATSSSGVLTYVFDKTIDYVLKITNTQPFVANFDITMTPKKIAMCYAIWDFSEGSSAGLFVKDMYDIRGILESGNIYPNILINAPYEKVSLPDYNNYVAMNSDYLFISTHGDPDTYEQNFAGTDVNHSHLPDDMSNVKLAYWGSCYSATTINVDGVSYSVAIKSAINGAQMSIGYNGVSVANIVNSYMKILCDGIVDGKSGNTLIEYANTRVKNENLIDYYNTKPTFPAMWTPFVATRETGSVTYQFYNI